MESKIRGMLVNKNGMLDYGALVEKYPWIIQRNRDCILSPDSDGLLCGLLMSHYLGWKIRGFYDGKILLIENGYKESDCVFLDMEIFRKDVRSIGQHMVMYDKNQLPKNWGNFENCISANNLRNFDTKHDFRLKYPFGTVHLLLGIIGNKLKVNISESGICPLLYTDGVFKNLFNYPENCLGWLNFLGGDVGNSCLHKVFFNDHYSISELMIALRELFKEIENIGDGKRGGDKIKISNTKGEPTNLERNGDLYKINEKEFRKAESFLKFLSQKTGWRYQDRDWTWSEFKIKRFKKGSLKPGKARYNELLKKNPLSLAVISGLSIEYTLEN